MIDTAHELSPASNTIDGISLALDLVEAECMANVPWSTRGEARPRQFAARRRIESRFENSVVGRRPGADDLLGLRSHPMARGMVAGALNMARAWVARLARRRERAAEEEEEEVEEEEADFDLFD